MTIREIKQNWPLYAFAALAASIIVIVFGSMAYRGYQCDHAGRDHIWFARSHVCLVVRDGVLMTETQAGGLPKG